MKQSWQKWFKLFNLVSIFVLLSCLWPVYADDKAGTSAQAYLVSVEQKIQKTWSTTKKLEGHAQSPHVRFDISPDGLVKNPKISKSSTIPRIDALALQSVMEASPFPKVPASLVRDGVTIDMELRINYLKHGQKPLAGEDQKLVQQARQLFAQGHFDNAVKLLQSGLSSEPRSALKTKELTEELAELYFNQATLLSEKDPHSQKALELAKKAQVIHPEEKEVLDLIDKLSRK